MSSIEAFTNFVKDRAFAVDDLKQFADVIEPVQELDGSRGYRLKRPRTGDTVVRERIIHRCKMLMYYTWHSRDYVKKILVEQGIADFARSGKLVNEYLEKSRDLQISSYLANENKHAGIDDSQKWATDLAPRYGDIYVCGIMRGFPLRMTPTAAFISKSEPQFELTGFAQVDDQRFPFVDFVWTVSCVIEDKDKNILGHAVSICERGFQTWLHLLREHGVDVPREAGSGLNTDTALLVFSKKRS
jgi:hypothetical protein